MGEYWVEQSAKNLFSVLDKDNKGAISGFLMGFSWGLDTLVDYQTDQIFRTKILPFSSKNGADMFNFRVTIRNSLLFCSSCANDSQVVEISKHFYRTGRIDYNICHPTDIPGDARADNICQLRRKRNAQPAAV